jgi:hypothetical protein
MIGAGPICPNVFPQVDALTQTWYYKAYLSNYYKPVQDNADSYDEMTELPTISEGVTSKGWDIHRRVTNNGAPAHTWACQKHYQEWRPVEMFVIKKHHIYDQECSRNANYTTRLS